MCRSPITPSWQLALFALSALAVAWFAAGCTTVIIPPQEPPNPVSISVIDVGSHAELVLPDGEGGGVSYVYGDWSYFALGKNDLWHGLLAVVIPTQGALGRKHYATTESLARQFTGCTVFELQVSADRVANLLNTLDARFHDSIETLLYNSEYELEFVKDTATYIWFHNCNTVLVDWLQELGCESHGWGWYADFAVRAESA